MMGPEPEDKELLAGIARGDHESFATLFDRYSAAAFGIASRVCADRAIAEDVVQETFLSLWKRPAAYEPSKGAVAEYLMGAVHHKAVDAVRHEQSLRRREQTVANEDQIGSDDDVVEAAWILVRRDRVREAIVRLSDVQREALELAYMNGLTYAEVADKLNIPLGTAKTRLRDGMIKLRQMLQADLAGEAG